MGKGNGSTRASASNNSRGLGGGRSINGWNVTTDSWGSPALKAKGADAEIIYHMLSTPVERLVEERTGSIRSGGGYSGERGTNAEYSIIFRDGTTRAQMREYMEGMSVGAKLLNNFYESHSDADRRAYNDWAEEYRLKTRRMNHPEEFD